GASVFSAVDVNISAEGRAQTTLPEQEAVFVRGLAVVEGADGFFLKVLCHDEASRGPITRFWDRDLRRRFELSPRCLLDEDSARQKIRIEPATEFTVSPTRGGFRVHGPFARGAVTLVIEAGARSVDGGVTVTRYRRTVMIPARRPKLEFVAQGRYLPASAWGGLSLRHQNVSAVDLSIRHVTRENVVRWLSDGGEVTRSQNSDVIFNRRIELQSDTDVLATSTLAMQDFLPDPPSGLVEISVVAPGVGTRSTVRFSITDINILAKRSQDGAVQAWVLGAHDHQPVVDATVEMVVPSGRRVSQCRTDESGGCRLTGVEKEAVDQTQPFALLASTIDDFSFIRFDQLRLNTSTYDVHGAVNRASAVYRAAVYGDRGVYRPGDTAHIVAIVRDRQNKGQADIPVQIELFDPKRKVSRRLNRTTNGAGMVAADFSFADYADTGRYQTVFRIGQREVARYAFNVEEFVPERMEVEATAGASDYAAKDEAQIAVSARYLFGGSAAQSRFDVSCALAPARFEPVQHSDYVFDAWTEQPIKSIPLGQASGTLDADGAGRLACPSLTGRGRLLGPTRLHATVSVFESGSGRTTEGHATAFVHPHSFYVGLKSDVQAVKVDRTFSVQGVVVGWDGVVRKDVDRARIELLKVEREHGWVYDELEGRWTHRRHTHLVSTLTKEIPVKNGRFEVGLKTPESAQAYVVRARVQDTVGDLKLGGAWYSWWSPYYGRRADATPRPIKPGSLMIDAPTEVDVSQTVPVSVEVPHRGRLLWTLESSGLIQSKWIDVTPGRAEWSFKVDAFEPNVYVSALLLKDPHEEGKASFLPSRSYGVASVRIRPRAFIQTASIRAPDEVRSNQPLEIEVDLPDAQRPSFVTVAAVDEGVLSLTKFSTPDPVRELFRRRALGVQTFETVGWNVSLPAGGVGRSTGGGGPKTLGRIQMIKPVALWSGLVKVPEKGPVRVRFDVPQYRGKLRVMAVGAGPSRLISASRSVQVRDPIVLQTTLPRFMVQGDEVQVPVFLTNMSGVPQEVEVQFSAEPLPGEGTGKQPLEVRGPSVRRVDLDVQGQTTVIYRVKAKTAIGAARLRIQAQTAGRAPQISVQETLDVPFVPNAPRTRLVQRVRLPTKELDLKPYLQGWLPTTESSTFWVTSNPYGDVFEHLTYLMRYPYGCIEQTTSSVRPLLFLGDLMRRADGSDRSDIENKAQTGIDRVLSMQTPSGGFGYWPGASEPVYWGTAYATHMLLEAQKTGFAVPQDRIDEALAWMSRALRTSSNPEQAQEAKPYIHYVLALAGRGEKAAMIDLLDRLNHRQSNDRWRWRAGQIDEMSLLLRAGLYLAGDRRFENELLNVDTTPVQDDRLNGWAFYSDRRRRGLALSTLVEVFGPRSELEPLARSVADGLRGQSSRWYTTQELAWGVTGLGKLLGKVTKSFGAPQLLADGEQIEPAWIPAPKADRGERTYKLFPRRSRLPPPTIPASSPASSDGIWPPT
ncbi:MAG: MG2 domain-containing protein, partial [Myxococcota bacterium]